MTPLGICILVVTIFISWKGLRDSRFYDACKLQVGPVLAGKDFKRLLSSGFLHVSWGHLVLNLFGLFAFGATIEALLGWPAFLLVYFGSMIGGGLLALLIHRRHPGYSAAGASGAICGLVFAGIVLVPGLPLGIFLLPFSIPAWLFGVLYIGLTIWAIRGGRDNVGHETHLGGALVGMLIAVLIHPGSLFENYPVILLIALPTMLFIVFVIRRPEVLLIDNLFHRRQQDFYSIDHRYNAARRDRELEIDRILDKISRSGMESLTKKEREQLERQGR